MKRLLQFLTISMFILVTSAYADPLRVSSSNPRYFADSNGNVIYLTGSHTWENLMDVDLASNDPPFDWTKYLDFLQSNNHNFFRLWVWENAKWATFSTAGVTLHPLPFSRPGPRTALDGEPKFDLTSFNQDYFDRLRQRVIDAGERGMYVSVMLFNGWAVESKGEVGNPWPGHPFNKNNNINGINGDPNNDNNGQEVHTLQIPAVTAIQEAYVRKVVDTLNDLDNVLYEICNEGNPQSVQWQYHMIDYIKSYEAGKPNQHPVGMTVIYPSGKNSDLFSSPADWISPNSSGGYDTNPPASTGAKVIITDSDHLWGIGGDRYWAWKSFTRGMNILFMDEYDFDGANVNNRAWVDLRKNLGYIRMFAQGIDLAHMVPRGDLASTGYALASNDEFLVYLPSGGSASVNLTKNPGPFFVEWFNPQKGTFTTGNSVPGGTIRSFTPPFRGDAILHLLAARTLPDTDPPSIPTGLTIDTVSESQVYISWAPSTDNVEVSGYNVFRDNVQIGNTSDNQYHDSNLNPGTIYRYSVSAYDAAGNESEQSPQIFVATSLADDLFPIIENISVSGITDSSTTISWITDKLSDSTVEYGMTTDYDRTVTDSTLTNNHSVTLVGLSPGTLYHFRVKSNSATSSDMTFRTKRSWSRWWWR